MREDLKIRFARNGFTSHLKELSQRFFQYSHMHDRIADWLEPVVILTLLLSSGSHPLFAQESHVERLQRAGVECLGAVPSTLDQLHLNPSERAPYVRTALVRHWMESGKVIFSKESAPGSTGLPALQYTVDRIGIDLGKIQSGRVPRIAFLGIRYVLTGPDSEVLADSRCDSSVSDTLSVELARLFQDDRFPETDVQPAERNWFKRYLQPAVVIGAAAVGTFLLFNLRSNQSDGG